MIDVQAAVERSGLNGDGWAGLAFVALAWLICANRLEDDGWRVVSAVV